MATDQTAEQMRNLVAGIAHALVDQPNQVSVESELAGGELVVRLLVAEDDLGMLIGKQGRTARSLRTIAAAVGSRMQVRCQLDVQARA